MIQSLKLVHSPSLLFYTAVVACAVALNTLIPAKAFAQEQEQANQSLLWKISGGNLKQPSYLYGTIHAICVEDMVISEALLQAMQHSKQLALEVNIANATELKKMQEGTLMLSPRRLSELLSAQEYQQVERFYRDSLGVALNQLQNMKPFFVSALLYSKLLDCPVLSYEMQLSRMMGLQNKPVVGLEGSLEQLKALDGIPYQEQAQLLLEAVQNWQELKDGYWNMVVSYKNQDLESLYHVVQEVSLGMKDYEKLLLTDRSRRWIPTIESIARNKSTFFAVGAAHLPGEEGIIKLLQRRGYTVEPVQEY